MVKHLVWKYELQIFPNRMFHGGDGNAKNIHKRSFKTMDHGSQAIHKLTKDQTFFSNVQTFQNRNQIYFSHVSVQVNFEKLCLSWAIFARDFA